MQSPTEKNKKFKLKVFNLKNVIVDERRSADETIGDVAVNVWNISSDVDCWRFAQAGAAQNGPSCSSPRFHRLPESGSVRCHI